MKAIFLSLAWVAVVVLAGCGGSSDSTPVPPPVSLTVSPGSATVIAGQTQQFTATVSGTSNTAVTWSLAGNGCSGDACGSLDASGLYTAPSPIPASATVTVKATSAADTTKSGTATVTHVPVTVAVSPTTLTLISAGSSQLSASVDHVPEGGNSGVTWSVAGGGTIDGTGLYSAPAKVLADATVTVTAASQFDPTKTASMTVALKAPVVTITPNTVAVAGGGAEYSFATEVTNVPAGQDGVAWSLTGLGQIDVNGSYHSPMLVAEAATDTVRATSLFDDSKVGTATVTLTPILVTLAPESATLYAGQTQQFSAEVAHHLNHALTWSASGSSCAGDACGSVSGEGLYTAPAYIPDNMTVTVTATSIADGNQSDIATVTLIPVSVTVSPKTATVSVTATQQFSATVEGGSNTDVTWTASGSGCSGSECGTISTTGLYTAPDSVPASTVTVTAASVAEPAKSDTATVTVTANLNAKLQGAYAFSYTGYDATGKPQYAVGSFVADGEGALEGLIDTNGISPGSRGLMTSFTGTYQISGGGNRGEARFASLVNPMSFRFSLDSTGDNGHIIRLDYTGSYGSGFFKRQDPTSFLLNNLNGDYVMGMSGTSSSGNDRIAVLGRWHTDGTGAISDTSLDVSETGAPPSSMAFTGNLAMDAATGSGSGRGTMAATVPGLATLTFAFYLINAQDAFILSTDPMSLDVPLFVGSIQKQAGGPFSNASFSGKMAFHLVGRINQTIPKPAVTIGSFDLIDGAGRMDYTTNGGGTAFSGSSSSLSATIDAKGRGEWDLFPTNAGHYIFYLAEPNRGFLMQFDDVSVGDFGYFEPQSGEPFDNTSLTGDYYGGAVSAATNSVSFATGIQTFDGSGVPNGNWAGLGDLAGTSVGYVPDSSSTGTYIVSGSASGAANWEQTNPSTYNKKMYVVSPNKVFLVPMDASVTNTGLEILQK